MSWFIGKTVQGSKVYLNAERITAIREIEGYEIGFELPATMIYMGSDVIRIKGNIEDVFAAIGGGWKIVATKVSPE